MKTLKWKTCLQFQIVINFLILALFLYLNYTSQHLAYIKNNRINLASLVILSLLFILSFFKNDKMQVIKRWLDIFFLPLIFIYAWTALINHLLTRISAPNVVLETIVIVYLLLYLFLLVPVTVVDYGTITNKYARIIAIIILIYILEMTRHLHPADYSDFLVNFCDSYFIQGLALVILTYFLVKRWGFYFRLNQSLRNLIRSTNFQIVVFLLLILFSIWYCYFDNIASISNFSFFDWHYLIFAYPGNYILSASAAILEETYRYLALTTAIFAFKNLKGGLELAIFTSALIFSSTHFDYFSIISGKDDFRVYLPTAIDALGLGIFLAVLFLYTRQIWLIMLFHFYIDFLSVSSTNDGLLSTAFLCFAITLTASVLMLFGKRRKVIQESARNLIELRNSHN